MQASLCNGSLNEFMRVRLDTEADASALDCMALLWRPDITVFYENKQCLATGVWRNSFFFSGLQHLNFQAFEIKLSLIINLSLLITKKTTYQNCPISLDCV